MVAFIPAAQRLPLGIDRKTDITIRPLHNFFAPRLGELPGLVPDLPGAPGARSA